jgi:2-keto-3-deoxy-galactonokinase
MTTTKPKSVPSIIFAVIAIFAGLTAFLQAGMRGHRVGWEEMSIYTGPAVIAALISIATQRSGLSYAALVFGAIAVVSFFLGA